MAKRYKLSRGKSKHIFSKHAMHIQSSNLMASPMRGGFRF